MATENTNITFKGDKLPISGSSLKVGDMLPSFTATATDMSDFKSETLKGNVVVISTVPSLDTPTCSIETKRFNTESQKLGNNVKIVTLSMDLPFAQKRWCGTEGVESVITVSDYKHRDALNKFGAFITSWGLFARAIFVADKSGKITYVEYVNDIAAEPEYAKVLDAINKAA